MSFFDVKKNIIWLKDIFFVCKNNIKKLPVLRTIKMDLIEHFELNKILVLGKRVNQFRISNLSNITIVEEEKNKYYDRKKQYKSGINIQIYYYSLTYDTYLQPLIYLRNYIKNNFKFDTVKMFVGEELKEEKIKKNKK